MDFGHAARAKGRQDFVRADPRSGAERHAWWRRHYRGSPPDRGACQRCGLLQEASNFAFDKVVVGGVASSARQVATQRGNGHDLYLSDELTLVLDVTDWEVQVRLTGHVEHRNANRPEGAFDIAALTGRSADVVPLPRARLCDEIVSIPRLPEAGLLREKVLQRGRVWLEHLAPEPFLRAGPRRPVKRPGRQALQRRRRVVSSLKGGIGRERADRTLQADDAM